MNAIATIRYAFGANDRITISGATYRYVGFRSDRHEFQLFTNDVLEDYFVSYDDKRVHELVRRNSLVREEGYFSKALAELRMRQDNTVFSDLDEEDVRTVFWKREWCVRFNRARAGLDGFPKRLTTTHDDIEFFINEVKDEMLRWYFKRYGVNRRPGRPALITQEDGTTRLWERKPFDYPNPTALRNWLTAYRAAAERVEAFFPAYKRCGNRKQLNSEVDLILDRCVQGFKSLMRPAREDIVNNIAIELRKLNANRGTEQKLSVSRTTINLRIAKLNPFAVEAGRFGIDAAMRKYAPAGRGLEVENFLDRVEIDDWTVDLFAIICKSSRWKTLSKEDRAKIPRVRATVTIAIDCATRCIVGLNISETTPCTAAAKGALRTIVIDKDRMAKHAGASSDWPMQGRPGQVVTDGGPVFKNEFEHVVAQMRSDRTMPDRDPSMRGYVEAVNRTMKAFCRHFTGQSFANVVVKGDYDGEAMASLDFETFYKSFIHFVIDSYHHRKHRGLGGMTPYSMWELLTDGRREMPMDPTVQLSVFGLDRKHVTLDTQGVLVLNVSYWSPQLGALFTLMGPRQRVDLKMDPSDIGAILVRIPKHLRKSLRELVAEMKIGGGSTGDAFLVVPSADLHFRGMSLVEKASEDAELRRAAKAAQEKGDPFRLAAHESLNAISRRSAREVGVQDHLLSQKAWDTLLKHYRFKALAATPQVQEDEGDQDDDEAFGTNIAKGRPTGGRKAITAEATVAYPSAQGPNDEDDHIVGVTGPHAKTDLIRRPKTKTALAKPAVEDEFLIPNINEIGLKRADE